MSENGLLLNQGQFYETTKIGNMNTIEAKNSKPNKKGTEINENQ